MGRKAVIVLVVVLLMWASSASAELRFRASSTLPLSALESVQLRHYGAAIERATGGEVQVTLSTRGRLLNASEAYAGVLEGRADIVCLPLAELDKFFPASMMLTLPVRLKNAEEASEALWKVFTKYDAPHMTQAPIKVLAMYTTAPISVMSKMQLPGLESIRGVHMRTMKDGNLYARSVMAVPFDLPLDKTGPALRAGTISALIGSADLLRDLNYAEFCRYVVPLSGQVHPYVVFTSREHFESLPETVQKALDGIALEQSVWAGQEADRRAQESLNWALRTRELVFSYWPRDDLRRFSPQVRRIVAHWAWSVKERGYDPEELFTFIGRPALAHLLDR